MALFKHHDKLLIPTGILLTCLAGACTALAAAGLAAIFAGNLALALN